jgi:hypothetical protein
MLVGQAADAAELERHCRDRADAAFGSIAASVKPALQRVSPRPCFAPRSYEPNGVAGTVAPGVPDRIAMTQILAQSQEEQLGAWALCNMHLSERSNDGSRAIAIGSYYKHAEGFPAELSLVLPGGICVKICSHLSLKAGLPNVRTDDRHRPAIDFNEEATARAIPIAQAEDKVWDDSNFEDRAVVGDRRAQ